MTISVPPENENSSTDEETPPSNEPASPSPSTPPTPIPAASATDPNKDRYINVLEETLRENNRIIQGLQSQIAAPPAPVVAAPTAEEEKQRFYNDPGGTTRSIVEEALARTISPLNDFVRGLKIEGSPYDRMLSKFKADARFAPALADPHVMAAVEQIMNKAELSEVNMQSAIVHAIGLQAMGLLGTITGAPAAPTTPVTPGTPAPTPTPSTVLPPHVRPSGPPAPSNTPPGAPRMRQLTETEKRLARENRMTDEQYLKWLETPSNEVATADFDKPKPK